MPESPFTTVCTVLVPSQNPRAWRGGGDSIPDSIAAESKLATVFVLIRWLKTMKLDTGWTVLHKFCARHLIRTNGRCCDSDLFRQCRKVTCFSSLPCLGLQLALYFMFKTKQSFLAVNGVCGNER
eukprot:scaffold151164_cov31-Prasinocladus_malaysianus.AAC.4